ncbi:hypothetical protein CMI47_03995 [Candidatus Pacearchaeota archaeon]|nr:hypothetical protein [Candidatus Pacearchaeota archaeon]
MKRNKKRNVNGGGVKKALSIHREKMEREGKVLTPSPEREVKHPDIMTRKDGKPVCFVCSDKLNDLRDLLELKGTSQEGTQHYDRVVDRVRKGVVSIGGIGRNYPLYRCTRCEPGSPRWNKNEYLRNHFARFMIE